MNRNEIKGNIRYNEDLVRSYQKSIQILDSKINELVSLKSKIQSCQRDFSYRERDRKNHLINGFSGRFYFKSITSYTSGMSNLLEGYDYRRAYNGLSEAIKRIDTEIGQLRWQRDVQNEKLLYRRKRIVYWRQQLRYAR